MDFTPLSSDEKCVMTKLTHSGPPDYIVETTANYLARRGPIKAGRICILDQSKNDEEYNVAYITQEQLDNKKDDAIDVHITPDTTETLLVESIGTIEKKSDGGRRRLRKTKRGRRHRTKRTRSRK